MDEIELLVLDRLRQVDRLRQLLQQPSGEHPQEQLKQFRMSARDEQKQRIDKENWILNILRSAKQLSPERKKYRVANEVRQFLESSARLMQAVRGDWQPPQAKEQLADEFTEQFINMYADFFEELGGRFEFKVSIKQLIRPNNVSAVDMQRGVVVDLVKYLVNFTRDYFKQAVLQSQGLQEGAGRTLPSIDNSTAVVTTAIPTTNTRDGSLSPTKIFHSHSLEQRGSNDFNEPFVPTLVVRYKKPNMSTFELLNLEQPGGIYQRARGVKPLTRQEKEELAIAVFLKLKDLNYNIRYKCEQWRFSLTGSHKFIPYNYHNLYTQQQIERLHAEIAERRPLPNWNQLSQQQLRQYVKQHINSELQNQLKPRLGCYRQQFRQYIVLRYDHRYPLEVVRSEKHYQSLKEERRMKEQSRSSVVLSPVKERQTGPIRKFELKGLYSSAQSSQLFKEDQPKPKQQAPREDLCIVDRAKVLRIRKESVFPEVSSKFNPLSSKELTNDSADDSTHPYSSRSARKDRALTPVVSSRQDGFRNVRTFALSKNTSDPPPIEVLRLYQQQRNLS